MRSFSQLTRVRHARTIMRSSSGLPPPCLFSRASKNSFSLPSRAMRRQNVLCAYSPSHETATNPIQVSGEACEADGSWTVRAAIEACCSAERAFEILRDYENAPRIFSNIEASSVDRDSALQSEYEVTQSCKWKFLLFKGNFDVRLTIREDRPSLSLTFRQHESAFMRSFEGQWEIRPLSPSSCLIQHRLTLIPAARPPEAIEGAVLSILETQTLGIMKDLRDFILETTPSLASGDEGREREGGANRTGKAKKVALTSGVGSGDDW